MNNFSSVCNEKNLNFDRLELDQLFRVINFFQRLLLPLLQIFYTHTVLKKSNIGLKC
jgi:hypothetical protein